MSVDDVRAVMTAAASVDAAAELAFRIAAVAGARRAELASLRWTDEHDGQLLIDSAIEITKRGEGAPELREAATKTANVRTVTLDGDTVEMIDKLRRTREPYGPWMCGLGPELVSPDRISWWWKRVRQMSGIDPKWRLHDLCHWSAGNLVDQQARHCPVVSTLRAKASRLVAAMSMSAWPSLTSNAAQRPSPAVTTASISRSSESR